MTYNVFGETNLYLSTCASSVSQFGFLHLSSYKVVLKCVYYYNYNYPVLFLSLGNY